jgi:hypothetical protein
MNIREYFFKAFPKRKRELLNSKAAELSNPEAEERYLKWLKARHKDQQLGVFIGFIGGPR